MVDLDVVDCEDDMNVFGQFFTVLLIFLQVSNKSNCQPQIILIESYSHAITEKIKWAKWVMGEMGNYLVLS